MITVMDVKAAFNRKIKKVTGVGVGSHAIDEDIAGPIFFTNMSVISSSAVNKTLHRNNLRLRALYYPAKKLDKIDMYKVQADLEKEFRLSLEVKDRVLNVEDIKFDVDEEEGFMYFTFRVEYMTRYEKEEYDTMKVLEVREREV
ncbi:phage tail terminator family protein [Peptostreptococcus anaerobius]|uniref:phage tail terminator family protein n=1 Tax=Peptostreptococcus anaerobius TaxID=1261 RepID=UPI00076FBAE6|nr:hypothetical protein [Peptostreptococcus anaerobius]